MIQENSSKVILITGCSSGFGLASAAYLAERGYHVIATMRDLDRSSGLINELNKRDAEVELFPLDVTKNETIREVMVHIAQEHGYIDVLINNAGYGIGGSFEDLTDEEFRDQLDVNLFGVLNVTREALHLMRKRPDAKIINISSIAGLSSSPCFSAYNTSKWALEGFSEGLRYELKPFGIKVLLIEPGVYKTKIFYENRKYASNYSNPDSPYFEMSKHLKNRIDKFVKDNHKDVEDIARLIYKLINAKNPRFRNQPDIEAKVQLFMKRVLPFSLYSKIVESTVFKGFKITR